MKKLIIAATAIVTVTFAYRVYWWMNFDATTNREPFTSLQLDQQRLVNAYRKMWRDVIFSRLDIDGHTDDEAWLDATLLRYYNDKV